MTADERDNLPVGDGAPMTELDVKLPAKIAVSHAEQTLSDRETLPKVSLPAAERLHSAPAPDPAFVPEAFPSLDEAGRPTELVRTPHIAGGPRPLPAAALLLIGVAIGAALTLLVVLLVR